MAGKPYAVVKQSKTASLDHYVGPQMILPAKPDRATPYPGPKRNG